MCNCVGTVRIQSTRVVVDLTTIAGVIGSVHLEAAVTSTLVVRAIAVGHGVKAISVQLTRVGDQTSGTGCVSRVCVVPRQTEARVNRTVTMGNRIATVCINATRGVTNFTQEARGFICSHVVPRVAQTGVLRAIRMFYNRHTIGVGGARLIPDSTHRANI